MRLSAGVIYTICVFILSVVLPFYDQKDLSAVPEFLRSIVEFFLSHRILTSSLSGAYVLAYTFIPQGVFLWREKKKLKKQILERMIPELLGGDLLQHRITLFREIDYPRAFVFHYWGLICQVVFGTGKWKLYLKWPPRGRYLVVNQRCGLQYKRSHVMFRVEENEPQNCDGIAAYIRFNQASCLTQNLPDISDINLAAVQTLRDVPKNRRKDFALYMKAGYTRDMDSFKRINRKARHFYGTMIMHTDGRPWGVLLMDSIGNDAPFNEHVRGRFDSFAKTLSCIVAL